MSNKKRYYMILRLLAVAASTFLWGASVFFSNRGFSIEIPDMAWIGWGLALCVTVIELVWTKQGHQLNITLFIAGLCAYAYGIWSNWLGISYAMTAQAIGSKMFAGILAAFLEIVPEPLLIWGLVQNAGYDGDFLSTLLGLEGGKFSEVFHQDNGRKAKQRQYHQSDSIRCKYCGKPTQNNQAYCSRECRDAYHAQLRKEYTPAP